VREGPRRRARRLPVSAAPIDSDGDGFFDPTTAASTSPAPAPTAARTATATASRTRSTSARRSPASRPTAARSPDTDGDGILDPNDKCIELPETKNGYKDKDGCPDEVPKAVAKFAASSRASTSTSTRTRSSPTSRTTLDAAVKVLKEFDDVNVEISGHTDSDGNREHNVDLSRRRAEAVKKYLVDKGIAESRLSPAAPAPTSRSPPTTPRRTRR
jgi:outer membrane protein OmpA-like peptidoglycan-associated protein